MSSAPGVWLLLHTLGLQAVSEPRAPLLCCEGPSSCWKGTTSPHPLVVPWRWGGTHPDAPVLSLTVSSLSGMPSPQSTASAWSDSLLVGTLGTRATPSQPFPAPEHPAPAAHPGVQPSLWLPWRSSRPRVRSHGLGWHFIRPPPHNHRPSPGWGRTGHLERILGSGSEEPRVLPSPTPQLLRGSAGGGGAGAGD